MKRQGDPSFYRKFFKKFTARKLFAVTACVSDETRTVVQVEVTGDCERRDILHISGIELRDENGQPIPIFEVGSGEGASGPNVPGKDLPPSTLIRFNWGPTKDCKVTLHVSNINGADGDWNIEIPLTASPSIKFTTDFYYEEGDFSIRITRIAFAPTQTMIKFRLCNSDPNMTFTLSNETESVSSTQRGYYTKNGVANGVACFGSLDPDSDLTLTLSPYPPDKKKKSYRVVIPLAQLVPGEYDMNEINWLNESD